MGRYKDKLRGPVFPKAMEGDWYRIERSLGEYLRDVKQKKEEKDTPLLPKSDS
jgi:hypothetical protein